MNFNNIVNHMKLWCKNKAEGYEASYGNYGGVKYVGYQVAYELNFKLSTLIDKSFESIEDFHSEIVDFIDVHYEPSVINPVNKVAKHIIDKINREFCEYLEEIILKNDTLDPVDIPYNRVIIGKEANELREKFLSVWEYVNTSYWFPLMGEEPKSIPNKFFIMFNYLEPYMNKLNEIIGLPKAHIYSYGEAVFRPENCIETDELIEYGGCESIYADKDFSWAIYFSHEDTVAFAGSIVPLVKELLSKEKDHFDKFDLDAD